MAYMYTKKSLTLFTVFFILYEFNTYIANDMIMPGMLNVVGEFHSTIDNIAKSLSLFIIGGSCLQIFLGPMCERYGKRNILLFGNLLFLIASGVIPQVDSINNFLAARFFQGMGLCFIFIGYAMIHELFDDKAAVKLCSLISNISIFAPLIGPVIGSLIIVALNWRWVFAITTVLAVISLIGLAKNMPDNPVQLTKMKLKDILITYYKIASNRTLLQGGLIIALVSTPMVAWIGLAPILVMKTMGKSYAIYVIYQSMVFGGFILSSISIQFIAGRYSFFALITRGSSIALSGLIISFIFHNSNNLLIGGMFISSFGIGLFSGSIFRIAITATGLSNSMSAATMNIIQSVLLAAGLELINYLCASLNYTVLSFTLLNLIAGIFILVLCFNFAYLIRNRQWQ